MAFSGLFLSVTSSVMTTREWPVQTTHKVCSVATYMLIIYVHFKIYLAIAGYYTKSDVHWGLYVVIYQRCNKQYPVIRNMAYIVFVCLYVAWDLCCIISKGSKYSGGFLLISINFYILLSALVAGFNSVSFGWQHKHPAIYIHTFLGISLSHIYVCVGGFTCFI